MPEFCLVFVMFSSRDSKIKENTHEFVSFEFNSRQCTSSKHDFQIDMHIVSQMIRMRRAYEYVHTIDITKDPSRQNAIGTDHTCKFWPLATALPVRSLGYVRMGICLHTHINLTIMYGIEEVAPTKGAAGSRPSIPSI